MTVCLLVISDGRDDYLAHTLNSIERNVPRLDTMVHVDDTHHQLGFAGAVEEGWRRARDTGARWCLLVEQDFTFDRPVPLEDMIDVLEDHPHLVQMALLRQPCSPPERRAGGIISMHPESYVQREADGHAWVEHARFFTTNVSVIPRWVFARSWPQCAGSEARFGSTLFAEDPERRSAFWGRGEQWITHIGHERAGHGY